MKIAVSLVIGSAVALAGCASTQKVLDKAPTSVYESSKSAKEVLFCLQNKNNVPALEQPDGAHVVLIKNGYGGVAIALTVRDKGTGSSTEVRNQFGIIGASWKQCIGTQVSGPTG